MNAAAIKSMEEFAQKVLTLPAEVQNEYFNNLAEILTAEEVETLQKCVALYKLMTNQAFYNAAQKALGEQLYKEFNA